LPYAQSSDFIVLAISHENRCVTFDPR
jgi:hypothetical protein